MDIGSSASSSVQAISKKDLANLAREYRQRFASVQDQIRRSILKRPGLNVAARRSAAVDKVLISLYDRLVQAVYPQERYSSTISLIAQGGYGRKELDYYSDIDLLIIKNSNKKRPFRIKEVFEALRGMDRSLPVDPIVYTPDEINKRLALGDYFIREVLEQGKLMYESK